MPFKPAAHPIDEMLALLRATMLEHRLSLTRTVSVEAAPPAIARDRRTELAIRVLRGLEVRTGIEVSQSAAEKLTHVFASISLDDFEAWVTRLDILPADDAEWLTLIESLTVHETYVMRDSSQLNFFAAQLPSLIAQAAANKTYSLRFWSVGCATGEEAYSIAALTLDALTEAGHAVPTKTGAQILSPWRVEILGSDISRRVLGRARSGVYDTGPLSSFRDESVALLRHFPLVPAKDAHRHERAASPDLKAVVRFEQFNLMKDAVPAGLFDAVFCRNVLIYFSDRARKMAQSRLRERIRPSGYLLLGPTDTVIETQYFEIMWDVAAVIYRRS